MPHFERGIVPGLKVRPNYTNGCGKIFGKRHGKSVGSAQVQ